MLYRPMAATGLAVSTVTLSLGYAAVQRGRNQALELIYAALECGINSYLLENADPVLAEVLGEALSHVDRHLVSVGMTLGVPDTSRQPPDFSAEGMTAAIQQVLRYSGLSQIDLVVLHQPAEHELQQSSLNALKQLRADGLVRLLGISGSDPVMDAYVSTNAFDTLVTPYSMQTPWPIRNRIRAAHVRNMSVLAYDFYHERRQANRDQKAPPKRGLFNMLFKPANAPEPPPPSYSQYDFLYRTPKWTAEAICLNYALTEPAISSVIVSGVDAKRLRELAESPERDLPSGLSAQIEMAALQPNSKT